MDHGHGQRVTILEVALPSRLVPDPAQILLARCSCAGLLLELLGMATTSRTAVVLPPSCAGAGQSLQISAPNSHDFCQIGG